MLITVLVAVSSGVKHPEERKGWGKEQCASDTPVYGSWLVRTLKVGIYLQLLLCGFEIHLN